MNALAQHVALLPSAARDLVELLGAQRALELVERLGGTTLLVPKRVTAQGEARYDTLAAYLGQDVADALVKRYGGSDLYVPRCADALREIRDRQIRREYTERTRVRESANEVVADLARQNGLSDRRIWNILKAIDTKPTPNRPGLQQLRLI